MNKWALIADVARCTNCGNCALVTKDEHVGNGFPGYAAPQPAGGGHEWLRVEQHTRGSGTLTDVAYVPRMCNHCDDAPCVKAGDGAVRKRDDGIVIIDPVKAKGRKDLVAACPYGAISWNEDAALPQAWIFDAHLLDAGWTKPRCVQACPTGALQAVKLTDEELQQRCTSEQLEVLRPELGTRPRVFYRNLYRATHCFIGGNVCMRHADGQTDNVTGAQVELRVDGLPIPLHATTDHFGDFRIDGLAHGVRFELSVTHAAHGVLRKAGSLAASVNLGAMLLPGVAN